MFALQIIKKNNQFFKVWGALVIQELLHELIDYLHRCYYSPTTLLVLILWATSISEEPKSTFEMIDTVCYKLAAAHRGTMVTNGWIFENWVWLHKMKN